jgi:amino acid transporter
VTQFANGMLMMCFCVAALMFLRFWRRSRDRLFLMFSIAFWIMALNRLGLAYLVHGSIEHEHQHLLYVVRLLAFVMILAAIIDKNRTSRRGALPPM